MFYNLGDDGKGLFTILDTDDNVSENYCESDLKKFISSGVPIKDIQRKDIVLSSKDNEYKLKIFGTSGASYRGKFANRNNRGDLFGFEIHLRGVHRYKNYIICIIVCNCWCKYDIEVPMFMFDLIAFDVNNIYNSFKCIFTSRPVYECLDMVELSYMQGDCPDDCCVTSDFNIGVYPNEIVVGTEVFTYVPNNRDIFRDIIKNL